ncbi:MULTISPECIES: AAA family ATPase [unclassified Curtobacterium]|uniref:AAA family ATPase n=1 Tax=unclassified Curtobacterium TaxID=257496 RepID=UPI0008DE114F|nr:MULTISPECIES: AAA family ATPase [unclassified Curtobacterium]OIH92898.1 ATPase [Curtobacterium sp. MCBA15_003]OII29811.1 ATPase [Curtobacterium sp. MMLR14_006]
MADVAPGRPEVLFLGGRSGVGKSTVAEALHDLLVGADVHHAVIEGDVLDLAHPAPRVAHPGLRLAERNLARLWSAYRDLGHHRLVFTNTVSVLEQDRLAAAVGDDPVVTAVLLRAGDDVTAERLGRRSGGVVPSAQLAHSARTARRLDTATPDAVTRVDTDGRTPEQVARHLASLTGWLPA